MYITLRADGAGGFAIFLPTRKRAAPSKSRTVSRCALFAGKARRAPVQGRGRERHQDSRGMLGAGEPASTCKNDVFPTLAGMGSNAKTQPALKPSGAPQIPSQAPVCRTGKVARRRARRSCMPSRRRRMNREGHGGWG